MAGTATFKVQTSVSAPAAGYVSLYAKSDGYLYGIDENGNNSVLSKWGTGTLTASDPITVTQTWNNAAVTFDSVLVNITDTTSNAASKLLNLKVGGTAQFSVTKAGVSVQLGSATAPSFIPSSSTVPTNGMFLPAANTLGWAINSAEKLRLDSSGNFLSTKTSSDTTAVGVELRATGVMVATSTSAIPVAGYRKSSNTADEIFVGISDVGGATNSNLIIYTNGTIKNTTGSYTTLSDLKLKDVVGAAGSQLADVLALSKIMIKYKLKSMPDGPVMLGWVAQEVQKISPKLVESYPDYEFVEAIGADGNKTTERVKTGTETLSVAQSLAHLKLFRAFGESYDLFDKRTTELQYRSDDHESRLAALEARL